MKYLKKDLNPEKTEETRKKNPAKTVAIVLGVIAAVLVLLAVGIAVFLWYSSSVRGNMFASPASVSATVPRVTAPTETGAEAPEAETTVPADWIDSDGNAYTYRDDIISILVMGIDYMNEQRYWDSGTVSNGGNADVLALVILNTQTFDFSILYIPRDTMADVIAMDAQGNYIDTVRTNISAAHSYGDGEALSCQLTAAAVSGLLQGVPVNRYVALDYNALYTLNDIIGGLTITFPEDYTFINYAFIKGETITMQSWQMRQFITYRDHTDVSGAYSRGERNMVVLKALFDQCKEQISADPTIALDFVTKLGSYLTTDLDLSEITFLATNIGKMNFGSDTLIRLPGESVMGEKYAEFHPDEQWLHDFVAETFCVSAE